MLPENATITTKIIKCYISQHCAVVAPCVTANICIMKCRFIILFIKTWTSKTNRKWLPLQ